MLENERLSPPELCPIPLLSRMEESNPRTASQSTKSAPVFSSAPLVVKGGQHEELVLPPLSLPVRRTKGEELVCGTVSTLLGDRRMNRQIIMVEAGSVEGEGEMEQGQNG